MADGCCWSHYRRTKFAERASKTPAATTTDCYFQKSATAVCKLVTAAKVVVGTSYLSIATSCFATMAGILQLVAIAEITPARPTITGMRTIAAAVAGAGNQIPAAAPTSAATDQSRLTRCSAAVA